MEANKTRILFVCPDISQPSGGIKQIYRQVDVLSRNGFNAYILHKKVGFRCTWFKNSTPVLYNADIFERLQEQKHVHFSIKSELKTQIKRLVLFFDNLRPHVNSIKITSDDVLVFPEIYGPKLSKVYPMTKKVIYNQGVYQTFFGYDLDLNNKQTPYLDKNLIAVLVNSEDAKAYLKLAFPAVNVLRVKYGFDHRKFSYRPKKKKQIAFMTRRLHADIVQVINILNFRGILQNWEICPIENMSESEVAHCMKESTIFLSFNINEGFGMPPAEAMASGCIVIGYPGFGGREIFKQEFCYPVPDRDVQTYVRTLEVVIRDMDENPVKFEEKSKLASDFILNSYSLEEENRTVLKAWNEIFRLMGQNDI